jgi:hypothetical protein
MALIRAALLALDTRDGAGAKERATRLNSADNPWRHTAREVIGTAAYQAGELQAARDIFTEIQQDAQTPPDLWVRSGMMVSLIDGQLAAPEATSSQGQPDAPTLETDAAAEPAANGDNAEAPAPSPAPEAAPTPATRAPVVTPAPAPAPSPEPSSGPMPEPAKAPPPPAPPPATPTP